MRSLQRSLIALLGLVLLQFYTNCMPAPVHEGETNSDSSFGLGQGDSDNPSIVVCEEDLKAAYEASYHSVFSSQCKNCHVAGPGIGTFAHPESEKSFASFQSIGEQRLADMAVNPGHQPGFTGAMNINLIEEAKSTWARGQRDYDACCTRSQCTYSVCLARGRLGCGIAF